MNEMRTLTDAQISACLGALAIEYTLSGNRWEGFLQWLRDNGWPPVTDEVTAVCADKASAYLTDVAETAAKIQAARLS